MISSYGSFCTIERKAAIAGREAESTFFEMPFTVLPDESEFIGRHAEFHDGALPRLELHLGESPQTADVGHYACNQVAAV